ncbi:MAG TPA: rod-binding protein [Terriglobales bacterium]|jgi:Rod binding domain-containing protein|nr:rod-binding protein [Terriglobales bacterium]
MPQINALSGADASQSLLQSRTQGLSQTAAIAAKSQDKSKIEAAANQFESILLQKWLEDAEHSFAQVPGGDSEDQPASDPGADQFKSLAMQQLAEKMTASGGVGIAKMIVRQMSHKTNNEVNSSQVTDSKDVTNGVLPPRNEIKVPERKDR